MSEDRAAIIASLAPLKAEARKRGHFLHCNYQDLWFSPDELDAQNAEGKFVWGAVNWTVRDPAERAATLKRRVENAENELMRWKDRAALSKAQPEGK